MIFKVTVLALAVFVQAVEVLSQQNPQPQQQQQNQGMTPAEMWNPYSWIVPYQEVASKAWTEYLQKAQEVSNQLYQQWEKTGAGNIFAIGMNYAQQAASEAQKAAEMAMNHAVMMKA